MTVTPNMVTDLSECRAIAAMAAQAATKVAELMQLHGIAAIHRYRSTSKTGAPVKRDVTTPAEFDIPQDIAEVMPNVGTSLLDYIECLGMSGMSMSMTDEDKSALDRYWAAYGNGVKPNSMEAVSADLDMSGLSREDVEADAPDDAEDPLDPTVVE